MAELNFKGKLLKVSEPQTNKAGVVVRTIVVEESVVIKGETKKYPITAQLSMAQLEHASKWKLGVETEVKCNVRGRKWTNPQGEELYFNTVEAWFVKQASGSGSAMQPNQSFEDKVHSDDSLPF